jgi:hypothetical protein
MKHVGQAGQERWSGRRRSHAVRVAIRLPVDLQLGGWTSSVYLASVLFDRDERLVVRMVKPDVERPQIGMEAGVLDRD